MQVLPGWSLEIAERCIVKPNWELGRVIEQNRHHYRVATANGHADAAIAGRLLFRSRSLSELPSVGDWVQISRKPNELTVVIQNIYPRTSKLSRKVVGKRNDEQVLVANIDQVIVVQSADSTFNVRRVERFAVVAKDAAPNVAIVLSKIDVCDDPSPMLEALADACPSMPIFQCQISTEDPHKTVGVDRIWEWIQPGKTVVIIGPSGVGKSTLINQLCGSTQQKTQAVNERHFKGTHTTTKRQLIEMPNGGILIDTPGLREIQLWETDGGIRDAFDDITELSTQCKFANCTHQKTAGCAVEDAVQNGRLSPDRLDHYVKLQTEARQLNSNLNRLKQRRDHRHLTQAKKGSNTPKKNRIDHPVD